MDNNEKLEQGVAIYKRLCEALTNNEVTFDPHDEALAASMRIATEQQPDPVNIVFFVKENQQILQLLAQMPIKADADKAKDFCYILNIINFHLVAGNFDYDFGEHQIFFRMTQSYLGAPIGDDTIFSMLMVSYSTVLMYRDILQKFNEGEASLDEVIAALQLH